MIGYLINIGEHAWYQRLAPEAVRVAAARGIEMLVRDADADPARQSAQAHELLDLGARVLAISPMDPQALESVFARCAESSIPIVTESIRTGDERVAAHLGIDEYAVGVRLGERVGAELTHRPIVRVMLVGFPPLVEAAARESGFLAGLRRHHDTVEAICIQGSGTTRAAQSNASSLLDDRSDWRPDIVFGVDDEVLIGALTALEARGSYPTQTATFGISPPHGPALLDDGVVSWGAAMLPELHGRVLGELTTTLLDGKDVPAEVLLEAAIVTASGHPDGWDRFYSQTDDEFQLIDYHAHQLLPAGVSLTPGAAS